MLYSKKYSTGLIEEVDGKFDATAIKIVINYIKTDYVF